MPPDPPSSKLWLASSVVLALVYSLPGMIEVFSSEYVVQDDARLHIFWMQRFEDPPLLTNDLIADYFQSLAPPGFEALYRAGAAGGVSPLVFNKLLPLVLIAFSAILCFRLVELILPLPPVAAAASVLLTQSLWMDDDLPSGTPRAFGYPLLLGVLYCVARRGRETGARRHFLSAAVVGLIALHASLDPPTVPLSVGIVALESLVRVVRRQGRWAEEAALLSLVLAVSLAVLLPYARRTEFGDLVSATEARAMPEFGEGGRLPFFAGQAWEFWLVNEYSGFGPPRVQPASLLIGLLLPLAVWRRRPTPLSGRLRGELRLLLHLVVAGTALYLAAHAMLFHLYFPSRFSHTAFRIVLAPATAITLALLLESAGSFWRGRFARGGRIVDATLLVFTAGLVLLYPLYSDSYPSSAYHRGDAPSLYSFMRQQPADVVVASLSAHADDLPIFSGRRVLVSPHYEMPWHRGYRERFRERALAVLRAQYTSDHAELVAVIESRQIDYWLLDADFLSPSYLLRPWIAQHQAASEEIRTFLTQGGAPAIVETIERCVVLEERRYRLLDAACIARRTGA